MVLMSLNRLNEQGIGSFSFLSKLAHPNWHLENRTWDFDEECTLRSQVNITKPT